MVGVERLRPSWVSTATRDAIRHFAWGVGDNNPLWTDIDHAQQSRWGTLIAPPCFLYAIDETTVSSGHPDRRRVYRSVDWTFYDVVPVGSDLAATTIMTNESDTDDGIEQTGRVDFSLADGRLVASATTCCLRPTMPAIAIDDRPEIQYSGDQLETIERTILGEIRQGAVRRTWESTGVGDALGPLIKGPLSIMDIVAWCAATSGVVSDDFGLSEGGLDAQSATGPEQVAWIAQLVTDWMGDDAFLHRLSINVDDCPPLGATTTITGRVVELGRMQDQPSVTIDLTAVNQSGKVSASGRAIVLLSSDDQGPVRLPLLP